MANKNEIVRAKISGGWQKEGKFGKFFTGSFTREALLKELDKFPGVDKFQMFVSPMQKQKEKDPDILVTFTEFVPYTKGE